MANTYFQFKQFRIDQENCAMKVCTDSCLFGAVVPLDEAKRILDIGTGTGLLTLMAAQRSQASIDAVEIDPEAAAQASANFRQSPWSNRIRVYRTALQQFQPEKPYDVILCNPPFFLDSWRSAAKNEQMAKHATSLSFAEISGFAATCLLPTGKLCILLPEYEQQVFAEAASADGLFPVWRTNVRNHANGKVIRVIAIYELQETKPAETNLAIKQENGSYTPEFKQLLSPFYLAL